MVFLFGLLVGVPAWAQRPNRPVIAVFPVLSQAKTDSPIVQTIGHQFERLAPKIEDFQIIAGGKLKRRLRRDPKAVAQRCGNKLACLAALARQLRAKQFVVGFAKQQAGATEVVFWGVDAKKGEMLRTIRLRFDDRQAVSRILGQKIFALLGNDKPGSLRIRGAVGSVVVNGQTVGAGEGPHQLPSGRHEVTIDGFSHWVLISPSREISIVADAGQLALVPLVAPNEPDEGRALPPVAPEEVGRIEAGFGLADSSERVDPKGGGEEPQGSQPLPQLASAPVSTQVNPASAGVGPSPTRDGVATVEGEKSGEWSWLGYTGLTIGAGGAVTLGVAAALGLKQDSQRKEVERDTTTPQTQIKDKTKDVNDLATTVNLLAAAGGGFAALGLTLVLIDYFSDSGSDSSVLVAFDGRTVGLHVSW